MKRIISIAVAFSLLTFCSSLPSLAQSSGGMGDLSGITGGGTSSGGSSSGGSSSGGSSSGPTSSGMDNSASSFDSTTETPTFQGFQSLGSSSFVGTPNSSSFIGTDQTFDGAKTTTGKRTTTTTTRRTTAARTSSNRSSTMNRTSRTSTGNSVRAATTSEFAFSPMEVDQRTTELRSRITRMPNLSSVSQSIGVKVDGNTVTLTGNVPTAHDRKIAEQLVRLEPGVDTVKNQLVVAPSL